MANSEVTEADVKAFFLEQMMNWAKLQQDIANHIVGALENNQPEIIKEVMMIQEYSIGKKELPRIVDLLVDRLVGSDNGTLQILRDLGHGIFSLQMSYISHFSDDPDAAPVGGAICRLLDEYWTEARAILDRNPEVGDYIGALHSA